MTEPEGLTALLLQLSGLARQLADLEHREATTTAEIRGRVAALAALVNSLKADVASHDEALGAIETLDKRVADLADRACDTADDRAGYQPAATPTWWKAGGDGDVNVSRLRAWVEQIYVPGYGHLAATLSACWDQHPLCLYVLDWLSEMWQVLYLQPARTPGTLAGQAEWHIRLLVGAADLLAQETRRCGHAAGDLRGKAWPEARP